MKHFRLLMLFRRRSSGTGPASDNGLLLEDGTSFLLLEDGFFLLLES